MAWHSDAEKNLKKNGVASMSFELIKCIQNTKQRKRFPEYSKRKPAGHEG
jgi:hypothetical protein